LLAAKKAGKIRYIGFTGHKDPAVHLRRPEVAAAHRFQFDDSCQMPLNVMDAHFRSFAHQVLPKLVEQGVALLAIKPLAGGNARRVPALCVEYADIGSNYRLLHPGQGGACARSCANLSAFESDPGFSTAGKDQILINVSALAHMAVGVLGVARANPPLSICR